MDRPTRIEAFCLRAVSKILKYANGSRPYEDGYSELEPVLRKFMHEYENTMHDGNLNADDWLDEPT